MKAFLERFKAKYGIDSNLDAFLILVVFSLTGSLSVKVGKPVLDFLGIDPVSMSPWVYWPLRILVVFPVYQVLQLVIGTLFGQFRFFWNFEKKMFSSLARLFSGKRA